MDHMRRHTIRLEHLEYMVLDEADEMLNMGFREDIDKILESVPEERQTVLFSATMSRGILEIMKKYLTDPVKVQITKTQITVPSIRQYYLEVSQENKIDVYKAIQKKNIAFRWACYYIPLFLIILSFSFSAGDAGFMYAQY